MKSQVTVASVAKPPFVPFVLELRIETLEEALALRGLYGAAGYTADGVKKSAYYVDCILKDALVVIYMDAFSPIDAHLRKLGIL